MQFAALAQVLIRRWYIFLIGAILGLGQAYLTSTDAPQRFESFVTLQLNPAARGGLLEYTDDPTGRSGNNINTLAASYAEVLRSRTFGQLVVDQLGLSVPPEAVANSITARLTPNTNIMRLAVTWDNPQDARRMAQGVAEVFLTENLRRQQEEGGTQVRLAEMETLLKAYPTRLDALRRQRDDLDGAIAGGDTSRISELNNVEQRIQALETTYSNLLIETGRARSSFDTATILDSASAARAITTTPRYQAMVGGLLGGLVAAGALAFLLEQLDHRMRSPSDIVSVISTAPASVVGRINTRKWPKNVRRSGLVALHDSHTPAGEAFRTLRTYLRFKALKNPFKSIIVTSSLQGEGKTVVAANLAVTLAKAGSRVLLIDADFRRPELHKTFGVERDPGIMEALNQHESAKRAAQSAPAQVLTGSVPARTRQGGVRGIFGHQATSEGPPSQVQALRSADSARIGSVIKTISSGVEGLELLPVSHSVLDPTPLLGSEDFASFIKEQERYWDYVIIDTPPVGPVADALLVAAATDGILVVARNLKASRSSLRRTLDALDQTGKPILGVVLNDYRADPLSKYTSSGYYYHYGDYYSSDGADDVAVKAPRQNGTSQA